VATLRIVVNEQSTHSLGTYSAIDVTALRVELGALTWMLLDTDIKIAKSHSDIACSIAPSAADVTLSGRVLDQRGRAISRATVSVMDGNGNTRSGTANTFGYYSIKDLPSGEFYVVSASARGYTFSPRTLSLDDSVSGFDLYPDARPVGRVAPVGSEPGVKLVKEVSPTRRSVFVFYDSESIFDTDSEPTSKGLKILQ
jgi:hypothetical protein